MTSSSQTGPAGRRLVVGSVPYLNVRPLLRALTGAFASDGPWRRAYPGGLLIEESVPRELAARHRSGEFDAAIVPVFDHIARPGGTLLPGTCIAARGAVESVVLFGGGPLSGLKTIRLDPASLTSVNLLRVLCDWEGLSVDWTEGKGAGASKVDQDGGWPPPPGTGRLIIGDEALRRRGTCPLEWDLALAWRRWTGLPFVFAAWHSNLARERVEGTALWELFARMPGRVEGEIAPSAAEDGPAFGFSEAAAGAYLRRAIHFHLGPEEQEAIGRFGAECVRLGLVPGPAAAPAVAAFPTG